MRTRAEIETWFNSRVKIEDDANHITAIATRAQLEVLLDIRELLQGIKLDTGKILDIKRIGG